MKKEIALTLTLIVSFFFSLGQISADKRAVQYDGLIAPLSFQGNLSVLVVGRDNRSMIIDKSQEENFVGFLRAGSGIPWRIKTKTGNPFINDFTNSFAVTLAQAGFAAKNKGLKAEQQLDSIIQANHDNGFQRIISITANEWHTDQYDLGVLVKKRKLKYDLVFKIYDQSGKEVLNKKFSEPEFDLSKKGYGSGDYRKFIPEAVREQLETVLNDPEVRAALGNN